MNCPECQADVDLLLGDTTGLRLCVECWNKRFPETQVEIESERDECERCGYPVSPSHAGCLCVTCYDENELIYESRD